MPLWDRFEREGARFLLTDLVVAEALTRIGWYVDGKTAAEVGRALYASPRFTVERRTRDDDLAAMDLIEQRHANGAGFVDCVSFVIARRSGVEAAFSVDFEHFLPARFKVVPAKPARGPR